MTNENKTDGEKSDAKCPIFISGMSGRFPDADSVGEFEQKLFEGKDMITKDDLRWPPGLYGLPERHGKLKTLDRFDNMFFGVNPKSANTMDPQQRIMMEVIWEAIVDSGYNPDDLRGSNTAVFVGVTSGESMTYSGNPLMADGYSVVGIGSHNTFLPNRASFFFDFRGPSFALDAACSSGLLALQVAFDAIRNGQCDAAIVATAQLTLMPSTALNLLKLGMNAPDGMERVFDADASGYVRSEAVTAIFVQKKDMARRQYAEVLAILNNANGYSDAGINAPSADQQAVLLRQVYSQVDIDMNDISYYEAHGTGTKMGDPIETTAITDVVANQRRKDNPLLIGSVKSNMGHSENSAGICSLVKVLLTMERGSIPPNLHFNKPNPAIEALKSGKLKVVDQVTPYSGGYVSVSSMGFGGSNAHCVLKPPNYAELEKSIKKDEDGAVPRLLCYSSRTAEGCELGLDVALDHPQNAHVYDLLSQQKSIKNFSYRGFAVLNAQDEQKSHKKVQECLFTGKTHRPVWFVYDGMGSQWQGMAKQLMPIQQFRDSMLKSADALQTVGVNLMDLIEHSNDRTFENTMHCMVCIVAVQVALTDVMSMIELKPDGIVGHSIGEIGCAYADGCLSAEQAVLCAYYRGQSVIDSGLSGKGAMAAVGLSASEARQVLPPSIHVSCHNSADGVTVAGDVKEIEKAVAELTDREIFAKSLNSTGVAFHSPDMFAAREKMLEGISKVIDEDSYVMRSDRWISSSVPEEDWDDDLAESCSPEYLVNNAMQPVLFHEAIQHVPQTAVVVEIAPHCVLAAVLRRSLHADCAKVPLLKANDPDQLSSFLSALGAIHLAGCSIEPDNMYPAVTYPIPRNTPQMCSLIRWDHRHKWQCPNGVQMNKLQSSLSGGYKYNFDPYKTDSRDAYLLNHVIDGRSVFPMAGYMLMAWKTLCHLLDVPWEQTPVKMEDLHAQEPMFMTGVPFDIECYMLPTRGDFEIIESGRTLFTGKIKILEKESDFTHVEIPPVNFEGKTRLTKEEMYRAFKIRGLDYRDQFQGAKYGYDQALYAQLEWTGNWVTYLDVVLHSGLLRKHKDTMVMVTQVTTIEIDPLKHLTLAKQNDNLLDLHFTEEGVYHISGGIGMYNIHGFGAPRQKALGKHILERYSFVSHYDSECLTEYTEQRETLAAYKSVVKLQIANWLLKLSADNDAQQTWIETLNKSMTGSINCPKTEKSRQPLSELLTKISESKLGIFDAIKSISLDEKTRIMNEDPLYNASLQQRALKPLVDLSFENFPTQKFQIAIYKPQHKSTIDNFRTMVNMQMGYHGTVTLVDAPHELKEQFPSMKTDSFETMNSKKKKMKKYNLIFLDRAKNVDESSSEVLLETLDQQLTQDGFVLTVETTSDFELFAIIDATAEMLNEPAPQPVNGHKILGLYYDCEHWMQLFEREHWKVCAYQTDPSMSTTGFLVAKTQNQKPQTKDFLKIDGKPGDSELAWVEGLKEFVKSAVINTENEKVIVGFKPTGLAGLENCLRQEMSVVPKTLADVSLDQSASTEHFSQLDLPFTKNCYRDGKFGNFRHFPVVEGEMYVRKATCHANIDALVRSDMSSLNWVESPIKYYKESENLECPEVHVYYAPLNFRDVMLATGRVRVESFAVDLGDFPLGMEFSGRLADGRRVIGLKASEALATTLSCHNSFFFDVPDSMGLAEASSIPMAYVTAIYALIIRARMKKSDRVLIHAGTGAVGQAAINLALSYGCMVYATAGTQEKRAFLRREHPEMTYIGNTRDTNFEHEILAATNGQGVDLVLNSLSEDKLQASLRLLATHGRFVEIGKYDLQQNNPMGLSHLLNNIEVHGVLVDAILWPDNEDWLKTRAIMVEGLQSGLIKPLNTTVFRSDQVEEAFRFMSTGQHMGKVLIEVRQPEKELRAKPQPVTVNAIPRFYCHPKRSYLITGGLGGFGLELADWLVKRGAKTLVLTSRKGITTGFQQMRYNHWMRLGVQVHVSTLDLSVASECTQLVQECNTMGALGGVFHLAGVLADALLDNQTTDTFRKVAQMKCAGTWNLDQATRQCCDRNSLEHFVAFSSIAAGRGNIGQMNYAWANSMMERVIEQRRHDGYSGIAIQWGPIDDVGMHVNTLADTKTSGLSAAILPERMFICLRSLETFLSWNYSVVGSFVMNTTQMTDDNHVKADIISIVSRVMGIEDLAKMDESTKLSDIGLDSLMSVEIRQRLQHEFDVVLSTKEIGGITVKQLKQKDLKK